MIESDSMAIDPQLLQILVCPACHEAVKLQEAPDGSAGSGGLSCEGCGRIYPIRDGIPVMLIDEASAPTRPAPEDSSPVDG